MAGMARLTTVATNCVAFWTSGKHHKQQAVRLYVDRIDDISFQTEWMPSIEHSDGFIEHLLTTTDLPTSTNSMHPSMIYPYISAVRLSSPSWLSDNSLATVVSAAASSVIAVAPRHSRNPPSGEAGATAVALGGVRSTPKALAVR